MPKGVIPQDKVRHLILLSGFKESKEYELITTAKQYDERYGEFRYTQNDLQEMADNFNNDIVGTEIAVDLNHDPNVIAKAWIVPNSMSVKPSSKLEGHYSLYAKLHRFTPEGEAMVKTGAVRYFSLEIQHKFEKFIGSIKKTYKNVIRGLALTNRPVIKDCMPTFSEKNLLIKNDKNMENFKLFLSQLKGQNIVSLTEKKTLKEMLTKLSEDEQAEVAEEVKEVEAKDEAEAEAKDEKDEAEAKDEKGEDETKGEADEAKEDEAKEDEAGDKDLAETKKELAETKAKADRALTELRKRDLSEQAETMVLSDSGKGLSFGVAKADKGEFVDFLMTLSDKQVELFNGLWKKVKAVDFSEKGYEGGKVFGEKSEFAKYGEVDEDSTKLDKDVKEYAKKHNVSYDEAFNKVI